MTAERTTYNVPVGRKDNEFYFLEGTFIYEDGYHGATGFTLNPISRSQYEDDLSRENLIEYLEDLWRSAVADGGTRLGLEDWAATAIATDGGESMVYDTSGWNNFAWEAMREMGFTEEEYPIFVWGSCGRIFSVGMEFDEVYDRDLLIIINKAEAGNK